MAVNDTTDNFLLKKIVKNIILNFQLLLYLILNSRNADTVLFYDLYGLSLIFSKLLRKKTIIFIMGNPEQSIKFVYAKSALKYLICAITKMQFRLVNIFADLLISNSSNNLFNLRSGSSFITTYRYVKEIFRINAPFYERNYYIGYVGRFSKEKGFENLLASIPTLLSTNPKIQIMLIGDGPLRSKINNYIHSELSSRVLFFGWVAPSMMPSYLNKMRLIVVPSYTEGLPHVIIEAMACGTPVLAMPVGSIPDVIRDCETGFLLKSNDPKHIAENIIELLNKPELLEKVSINAYKCVRENFSYERTLESWRRMLQEI